MYCIWLLFTQSRCYQPYLPCNILHLSISKYLYNQWWRPMCDVFVQFVFISDPGPLSAVWSFPPHLYLMVTTHHDQYSARSRCLSPCPPYQLLEVSHHTSPPLISTTQLDELYIRSLPEEPHLTWVDVTFSDFRHLSWAYFLCKWAKILICWCLTFLQ